MGWDGYVRKKRGNSTFLTSTSTIPGHTAIHFVNRESEIPSCQTGLLPVFFPFPYNPSICPCPFYQTRSINEYRSFSFMLPGFDLALTYGLPAPHIKSYRHRIYHCSIYQSNVLLSIPSLLPSTQPLAPLNHSDELSFSIMFD